MIKRIIITAALSAASVLSVAQTVNYNDQYNRLVARVGAAGVGVETLIGKWEKADSADVNMLKAKFAYYFTKSRTEEVMVKPSKTYLGMQPVITLKDSLGAPVNYFQVPVFDEELFSQALKSIDKAIQLHPEDLSLYFNKTATLLDYEGESPDLTLACLNSLIDKWNNNSLNWVYPEAGKVDDDFFLEAVQAY
ncbi:MAG: hypothetical protein HUJ94_04105, partial [Bacteroidales bacterium]|nr:hypothetical protein [Bacteroidales bacterium]